MGMPGYKKHVDSINKKVPSSSVAVQVISNHTNLIIPIS